MTNPGGLGEPRGPSSLSPPVGRHGSPREQTQAWGAPVEREPRRVLLSRAVVLGLVAILLAGVVGGAVGTTLTRGEVIGVNTAIATLGSQGSIGIGFAIPMDRAVQVADRIIHG